MRAPLKLSAIVTATLAAAGLLVTVLASGGSPAPAPPTAAHAPGHDGSHE
jgi:hypothetical protein